MLIQIFWNILLWHRQCKSLKPLIQYTLYSLSADLSYNLVIRQSIRVYELYDKMCRHISETYHSKVHNKRNTICQKTRFWDPVLQTNRRRRVCTLGFISLSIHRLAVPVRVCALPTLIRICVEQHTSKFYTFSKNLKISPGTSRMSFSSMTLYWYHMKMWCSWAGSHYHHPPPPLLGFPHFRVYFFDSFECSCFPNVPSVVFSCSPYIVVQDLEFQS